MLQLITIMTTNHIHKKDISSFYDLLFPYNVYPCPSNFAGIGVTLPAGCAFNILTNFLNRCLWSLKKKNFFFFLLNYYLIIPLC